MKVAYADTFYFIALLNDRDRAHAAALALSRKFRGRIVTSDWVLIELADAMCVVEKRKQFAELYEFVSTHNGHEIVRTSPSDFDAGVELFLRRPDKSWSLTDCISFTIMQRLNITDAITGDHHFIQAGFNILLSKNAP